MAKKYYAVKVGHQTGIFTEWFGPQGAKAQVDGYSGAKYKGFGVRAHAERYLADQKTVKKPRKRSKPQEFKYPPNRGPKRSNPADIKHLYTGSTPPWEFEEMILCYPDQLRVEAKQLLDQAEQQDAG
jgi:hypothetical protein